MKIINLLPKPKQQELRYESVYHSVLVAIVIAVGILLFAVVVQVLAWAYMQREQVTVVQRIEQIKQVADKEENTALKAKILALNNEMQDFKDLSASAGQWSDVLSAFAKQIPEGVKINQFQADEKTGKITINGQSPTREAVIELYNNISRDGEHFKDIDYPLENVAKPTDVAFHFTFIVQDKFLHSGS
jgi:Tfp pilus assembly protein PilN